jgi:polar amino acid transport system substrate-binding protein
MYDRTIAVIVVTLFIAGSFMTSCSSGSAAPSSAFTSSVSEPDKTTQDPEETSSSQTSLTTSNEALPKKIVLSRLADTIYMKIGSEILIEAYQKLGIEAVIEAIPGARSLIMSNEGLIDGEISRMDGLEADYPNLVSVPVSLYEQRCVAFTKKDSKIRFDGWKSLDSYAIAAMRGAHWSEDGTKGMKNVVMLEQPSQMFTMLELGRVDVALAAELSGMQDITKLGYTDIQSQEPPLLVMKMYHYLNKKHSMALLPQITAVLQNMKDSGRIDEILQKNIEELTQK